MKRILALILSLSVKIVHKNSVGREFLMCPMKWCYPFSLEMPPFATTIDLYFVSSHLFLAIDLDIFGI